jgi:hypothetical protein
LSQLPELPKLHIVPTETLQPHEHVDRGRAEQLIRSLQSEGFLKNPPVVLPLAEEAERYVVLDGANRTTAFQHMGFPHMLVQIAQTGVEVQSWNHAFLGLSVMPVIETIKRLDGVDLVEAAETDARRRLAARDSLAYLATPEGGLWELITETSELGEQVDLLAAVVTLFEGRNRAERTNAVSLNGVAQLYQDLACLAVYPSFGVEDVVEVVANGRLFPSGITRFLISPRALRLNFPLALLADRSSRESKEGALEQWILQRMDQRQIRYYAESTFLFDE